MSPVDFRPEGLRLSGTSLWFDAKRRKSLSFISHAHSDHIARHHKVIATAPTLALVHYRLGVALDSTCLDYRQPCEVDGVQVELLPAGHILGSAQMLVVRRDGLRVVYTGDVNLAPSLTAEPVEIRRCDVLILESTFGHPRFHFEPKQQTLAAIEQWIHVQVERKRAPILLAYSVGKSQEIIKFLGNRGFRMRAHASICDVLDIYSRFGVDFEGVSRFTGHLADGEVGIFPPQAVRTGELRSIWPRSLAILTGWAKDPAIARRYRADTAFALSDHADFDCLVQFAKETGATEVITHHGFARELAAGLREHGITARAIGQRLQLDLFGPPQVATRRRAA